MLLLDICSENPGLMKWINLCDYSIVDIALVASGTLFWVICYYVVIRHGFRNKYVEMPMFVAAGNIAWEFVWSFIFKTNMGEAFLWGYRAWFFMDLFIFYLIIKYGAKQTSIDLIKKYWVPIVIGITVFFAFFFYYFTHGGYDTPIGATSAFFLSVGISTLYITLFLSNKQLKNFSFTAGWTRAVGDTIMVIFALKYYDIGIIAVMGAYVVTLDWIYVYLLYKARKKAAIATT